MPAAIRRVLPIVAGLICLAGSAQAQISTTGRITGRVINGQTGQPVERAEVQVVGTLLRAMSDLDGRYYVPDVPVGPRTIEIRKIGFTPKNVTGVAIAPDSTTVLDLTLTSAVFAVEAITVTADVERGSVNRALEEQRNAVGIVSGISSEQIKQSPDGDAAAAVQRVSGVTVQDGRFVFVRGLGERYTTTSLNGTRIPSAEPERRLVPLDLFPAGLLETITTSKTFTPEQAGDFSGAQVDLRTRDFLAEHEFSVSVGGGLNSRATGQTVLRAPRTGSEWLGLAGDERAMPSGLKDAGTLQGLSRAETSSLIRAFRNSWTAETGSGLPNGSFGLSLAGEDPILGVPLGYVGSLSYSLSQETRAEERRAIAQPGGTPGTFEVQNAYAGSTGRVSVLWGGLLNFTARLGVGSKVSLHNTYTRGAENEASRLAGFNEGFAEQFDLTRLTFVERSVRSHTLLGRHLLGSRHTVEWSGSASRVTRDEPDRSDLVYVTEIDSATGVSRPVEWYGAPRSASRTFSTIDESGYEGKLAYRLSFGDPSTPGAIKVGGAYKRTERAADTRLYDILNGGLTADERRASAEGLFADPAVTDRLLLFANANTGRYDAADRLAAGYAQLELPLGRHVQVVGGARLERSDIEVVTATIDGTSIPSRLDNLDVLPALALNVRYASNQAIRLSASQTVARPEYRELSPVTYFDILGGQRLFGNADLRRSLVKNADLRWEWYPGSGEVVSVAGFAKWFDAPIERVLVQTSDGNSPDATFVNAESARNYGVELDVRKRLGASGSFLEALTLFTNLTLMRSEIRPGNDGISSLTNAERPMVSQAPYVVNTGMTFADRAGRLSATVLYNRVGRRIREAGILPLPDTYEEARDILDVSLQLGLTGALGLKLDAKNLLDAPYDVTQGTVERVHYRTGRDFSASLRWAF
jgi:hypothetical protein